jgi:hypothetical protein
VADTVGALETSLRHQTRTPSVFVPGGARRTIPHGRLHDGEQFLINRTVAVTPSINLTDPPARSPSGRTGSFPGPTVRNHGFPPPLLDKELEGIRRAEFVARIRSMSNFRPACYRNHSRPSLQRGPHRLPGHCGGDVHDSYILAYDERFTMERIGEYVGLFRFRDEPLDMLTLSACETAIGNDRAALGLAGVAVRAGARSALATLWHVNDPASQELILEFYRNLRDPAVSPGSSPPGGATEACGRSAVRSPGYGRRSSLINDWRKLPRLLQTMKISTQRIRSTKLSILKRPKVLSSWRVLWSSCGVGTSRPRTAQSPGAVGL